MTTSTEGIVLQTRRRWLSDAVELLSSMRFAISLLTVISIASIVGTVVTQNEPMTNYVNQFGPFWFEIFAHFSIYSVYAAWWFLLIMAFLVTSTSLCITRNAPKMLKDMKSWRETVGQQAGIYLCPLRHCDYLCRRFARLQSAYSCTTMAV